MANDIIAVVGMAFEARIVAGPGLFVLSGAELLSPKYQDTDPRDFRGVLSFGIAGGLSSDLKPGTCVVASEVVTADGERIATDPVWSDRLRAKLPQAVTGPLAGMDLPLILTEDKQALHRTTGALAVDMESHLAARIAMLRGLPFAAVRVVADPASRSLPNAALAGMRPDRSTDPFAVMRALLRRPRELRALMRVALDVRAARTTLLRGRQLLGASLVFSDLG
ncbi:MAG TPA: phosphorylase [Xanthobacteraceae bacterium]|jgi:hopanoid-associated phosphorylase|nr:phosphorylase [Xanthobacteraceae bacterium]